MNIRRIMVSIKALRAQKSALLSAVRDEMRAQLIPCIRARTLGQHLERRKLGKVYAAALKRVRANPLFIPEASPLATSYAVDLSPLEAEAFQYFNPHTSRSWSMVGLQGQMFIIRTCPLSYKTYLVINSPTLSPAGFEVHSSLVDAIRISGHWYACRADFEKLELKRWFRLTEEGSLIEMADVELPLSLIYSTPRGPIEFAAPINAYHSAEKRQNLQPETQIHAGIELEFNKGSAQNLRKLAADIRIASDFRNIVERDRSITGFEVITGHAEPHVLRELAVRPIFKNRPLTGMRSSQKTGMHVHVTKCDSPTTTMEAFCEMSEQYRQDYETLAGRGYNNYATFGASEYSRRASISGSPSETFEFRLFQNPNSMPRVMANMQWAWAFSRFVMAGHRDYKDSFGSYLIDDLPRHDTVELRVMLSKHKFAVAYSEKELADLYPRRGSGITGVQRALSFH